MNRYGENVRNSVYDRVRSQTDIRVYSRDSVWLHNPITARVWSQVYHLLWGLR
jgi:hypothetical protein